MLQALLLVGSVMVMVMAAPQVVFPFNSQVPPVARVGVPFNFTFADATFKSTNGKLQYSINDGPAWLHFDALARTLWGTPGTADAILTEFNITASDTSGSTSMHSTLVVTTSPAPTSSQDISAALSQAGNMTGPNSLLLHPGQDFAIDFSTASYAANGKKLSFYSTLVDRTPLPAWLAFNGKTLHYNGVAPKLSSSPQTFDVLLIASDVVGFAGVCDTFTVIVSERTWAFEPEEQAINIVSGNAVTIGNLLTMLYAGDKSASSSDLQQASAHVPPWLSFDPRTLRLSGMPPSGVKSAQINITAYDHFGDSAMLTLQLSFGSLLQEAIGPLKAYSGKAFEYTISRSSLVDSDVSVSIDTASAGSWLHFDAAKLRLYGRVPNTQTPQSINLPMVMTTANESQTDSTSIKLYIQSNTVHSTGQATTSTLTQSPTIVVSTSAATNATIDAIGGLSSKTKGTIAAVVICPILGVLAIILVVLYCFRPRFSNGKTSKSASRSDISRPIVTAPEDDQNKDLEMGEKLDPVTPEKPPRLDINLSRATEPQTATVPIPRSTKRFTQLHSIGPVGSPGSSNVLLEDGEAEALDGFNRSSWGYGPNMAPSTKPHDSMKVPTAMARISKRASVRRSAVRSSTGSHPRHRLSKGPQKLPGRGHGHHSVACSSTEGSDVLAGIGHGRISTYYCPYCPNPHGESVAPLQTHEEIAESSYGTEAPSLSSSAQSGCPAVITTWQARSAGRIPELSRFAATIRSAKAEKGGPTSEVSATPSEAADRRSIIEKRQSYIRNRAAMRSPFFGSSHDDSHSGKISSTNSTRPSGLGVGTSQTLLRKTRPGRPFSRQYSASSSLEPDATRGRTRSKSRWRLPDGFPRALGSPRALSKRSNRSKARSSFASGLRYEDASEAEWERRSFSAYSEELDDLNAGAGASRSVESLILLTQPAAIEVPYSAVPATDPPSRPLPSPPIPELPQKSPRRSMVLPKSAVEQYPPDELPSIERPDLIIAVRKARLSQLSKENKRRIDKFGTKRKEYPDLKRSSIMERPRSSYRPALAAKRDSVNRLVSVPRGDVAKGRVGSVVTMEQSWEDLSDGEVFL